ncbi:DUF11 domain-containing protein [Actinoplanes bogorensis]|uniref:DUF11 domain-containing protein n=1 Tax=Paractinoplanes bogorensis TaxID=1610840 RepID=A0ABS5Z4A3_9ACTN|nr:LPXTG cell wall anchor domain-containing protein [Actinoplanes bogorensis]MBU2670381.1 DUF11 domain-containing protein [Actinoplanes bogorensis]
MVSHRRVVAVLALVLGLLGLSAGPALAKAPVDLSASFNVVPWQVAAGYTADYYFQAQTLSGPVDTSAVRVELELPEGVSFVSLVDNNSGPCDPDGQTVTCTVTLTGSPATWGWQAKVRFADDLATGTRLTFRLTVSGAGEESNPENNTAEYTSTVVGAAEMGLSAIEPTGTIQPDDPLIFTLIVHNNGPAEIPEFGLSVKFLGIQYVGTKVEADGAVCREEIEAVNCQIDHPLAAGAQYRLKYTVPGWPNDSRYPGGITRIEATTTDYPDRTVINAANDKVAFDVDFAKVPASPSPTATTPPATPGSGGGGSLPITGSSALPLAGAGLAFLLAGAGALIIGRRRARA